MKAVKAVYQDGKIKLREKVQEDGPIEVLVVFPETSDDPWDAILAEKSPRRSFVKFAEQCLEQIQKGKSKPLKIRGI